MKFFLKNQGVITAFVTMIMVPVVVFTGIFVDMSRFKFCSSQAIMAADSYSEGVLSIYNNVLKELYGLYSISTSEEGKELIKEMTDYAKYSFNPVADEGFEASGHMPYASTEVEISHTNVEGATLANSNVLLTQIADFMQYRIIGEMVKDSGILDALEEIQIADDNSAAVKTFSQMGEYSANALAGIQSYYEHLKDINAYVEYKAKLEQQFADYSETLTEISCSEEYNYKKCYDYFHSDNKDAINQAKEYVDNYEMRKEMAFASGLEFTEELDATMVSLADQWVGEDDYLKLENALNDAENKANRTIDDPIHFGNAGEIIKALGKEADDLESNLGEIINTRNKLQGQLASCSEALKKGIEEDIEGLNGIIDMADRFIATYNLIEIQNQNTLKNEENKKKYEEALEPLNKIKKELIEMQLEPKTTGWQTSIELDWYDFQDDSDSKEFYKELEKLCKEVSGVDGDEDAGKKKIEEADAKLEEAMSEITNGDNDDKPERNIGGNLASQLKIDGGGTVGDEIGFVGSFDIGQGRTNVIDKFLLASYDFGMFSSRVTGIEEKDDSEEGTESSSTEKSEGGSTEKSESSSSGKSESSSSDEEYADYSLTKVEMSPDVNYLYKAELEYLFGGKSNSKANWNITRNTICSVRMAFNFASTYAIDPINSAINTAATNAQAAVTTGTLGLGAGAGVLVRIGVSAALRSAVAGCETAEEWKQLKDRESVLLFKTNMDDLEIADKLEEIIGESIGSGTGESASGEGSGEYLEIKLSYEDYLYLLMILFISTDTLTDRTANLITLNVNQSQNKGDTLSTLDFKMSETVTAIESTCKVKMDFIIVPDHFADMFISGSETEAKIKSLEDRYTGFTLIRGY